MLIVAQHALGRVRIIGRNDLVATALERARADIAHIWLIVNDEDSWSGTWASK
jgi:hypothetical protein